MQKERSKQSGVIMILLITCLILSIVLNIVVLYANFKEAETVMIEPIIEEQKTFELPAEIPDQEIDKSLTVKKYYDVPLKKHIQDFIHFCILEDDNLSPQITPALILAIIEVESGYREKVISKTNDYGLMQINIHNHEWLRKEYHLNDFLDPYDNIEAGIIILNLCIKQSPNLHGAITAYNRGVGGAKKLWADGIYETTYSKKVMEAYDRITSAGE